MEGQRPDIPQTMGPIPSTRIRSHLADWFRRLNKPSGNIVPVGLDGLGVRLLSEIK